MLDNRLELTHLPLQGCQLIEASAGTGKTYSMVRIYLRLLLERCLSAKQILVMTFTRAAASELRGRIEAELRYALRQWGDEQETDAFYRQLYAQHDAQQALPILHQALLELDVAPIHTIHGFCKQVLSRHAFATGVDFDLAMEQDLSELHLQAVQDEYRHLAYRQQDYLALSSCWPTPEVFYQQFRELLDNEQPVISNDPQQLSQQYLQQKQQVLAHLAQHQDYILEVLVDGHRQQAQREQEWQTLLQWLAAEDHSPMPVDAARFLDGRRIPKAHKAELPALLQPLKKLKDSAASIEDRLRQTHAEWLAVKSIQSIRERCKAAKRVQRIMGFDDLVLLLAQALAKESNGALAAQIRADWPVALVDEFQDTDPAQYRILQSLYLSGEARSNNAALLLIGDPKQAIYGFRGGDVFAYLKAARSADRRWQMERNWRSAPGMVNACNRLFHGAPLAAPSREVFGLGIEYSAVQASDKWPPQAFHDPNHSQAMQWVHFPLADGEKLHKAEFRQVIADWCAAEIQRLLQQARLQGQTIRPRDIAVLVRDRSEAAHIRQSLQSLGLNSVYLSAHEQLFQSREAGELLQALTGILEPHNERLARAALVSPYLGGDAQLLQQMNADENFWEQQGERLRELRRRWQRQGIMAVGLELLHQHYRPAPQERERALTNSLHLFEVLQQQASRHHFSPEQSLHWLSRQIMQENTADEYELRLESDDDLIRIQTQHGSKGLEYAIVFIPFASRYSSPLKFGNKNKTLLKYHEREQGRLVHQLGWNDQAATLMAEEAHAESIRLLYVAVTRAIHRCYLCTALFKGHEQSPLGLTLGLNEGVELQTRLASMVADEAQDMALNVVTERSIGPAAVAASVADQEPVLQVAQFNGHIDTRWGLNSFTSLTRGMAYNRIIPLEPEAIEQTLPDASTELRFALPGGFAAGNLLHSILERLDFTKPTWEQALNYPLQQFGDLPEGFTQSDLKHWMQQVLHTPLAHGLSLAQLSPADTLRETHFYYPVKNLPSSRLLSMLKHHWPDALALPAQEILHGMMQGYIDLIFQWQGRYYLLDYKSNHLGAAFSDYGKPQLADDMHKHHYDLQYLLYSLALHRYLRQRLNGYQPGRHFGGVYYLYLRGMHPDTDTGIYFQHTDAEQLQQLDLLFSGADHV